MTAAHPSATVTFLFTDLEGSTQLLELLGSDQYATLLTDQRQILRAAFRQWNGREIDTQGDAFFASFPRAADAVAAVVEMQRKLAGHAWPQGQEVRVRMGLHTGEPWLIEEGYVGMDVHRAARIAHAGHGGQVLLSETTTALVQDELPEGVELRDLGRHRLKDLRRPEHIHQLAIDNLPADYPPLKSLEIVSPPGISPELGQPHPPREVGPSPYRGLAAFHETDAAFFFGRETFTRQLAENIRQGRLAAVIVGPSGSGKSSAVFAGLLPRLRSEGGWLVVQLRPGSQPFQALAGALVPVLEAPQSETRQLIEAQRMAEAMQASELSLRQVVQRAVARQAGRERLLMVIDQFEELFTLCPQPETRTTFLDELLAALEYGAVEQRPLFALLLTLRADFMGQALAHRTFADALQEGALMLGPMTREELQAAIEKPAELQGAAFESGLVQRLLDDVGQEPGNLPLMEFALTLLWDSMERGWMTHAAYDEIGQVEGALARYADEIIDQLSLNQQAKVRRVFVQLVQPGEGTEDTRRIARREELADADWVLIQHLADERLVVTGRDEAGNETVEVVHEALIRGWGRLQGWMQADRAFRMWQEGLRAALRSWQESGQDEGALLRGVPLAQAAEWLQLRRRDLSQAEADFIQASLEADRRMQARRERRRRRTLIGLAAGALIAILLALISGSQWLRAESAGRLAQSRSGTARAASTLAIGGQSAAQTAQALEGAQRATSEANALALATARAEAEAQAREALARNLAASALDNQNVDPQLSLLLALEAANQTYLVTGDVLPEAQTALHQSIQDVSRLQFSIPPQGSRRAYISFNPDGTRLISHHFTPSASPVSLPDDTQTFIWETSTGDLVQTLPAGIIPDSSPVKAAIPIVQLAEDRLIVRLFNPADGSLQSETTLDLPGNLSLDTPAALAVNPNQDQIALFWSRGYNARVWNMVTADIVSNWSPSESHTIPDPVFIDIGRRDFYFHHTLPSYIAYTTNGEILLSAHSISIRLWDKDAGVALASQQVLIYENNFRHLFSLSPDGRWIAIASRDTIELRDFESWERAGILETPTGSDFTALSFGADSTTLATATEDGLIQVRDLNTLPADGGSRLLLTLADPQNVVHDLKISPGGERLATASDDGSIKIWDIRPGGGEELPYFRSRGASEDSAIASIALSPDGEQLALAPADGAPVVVNAQTGKILHSLDQTLAQAVQIEYTQDGKYLAICTHTGPLQLWEAASGELRLVLDNYTEGTCSFDFHPGGDYLALGFYKNETGWYQELALPELGAGSPLEIAPASPANWFAPHVGETTRISISPEGSHLGITSSEGEFFVWRLPTFALDSTGATRPAPSANAELLLREGLTYNHLAFRPGSGQAVSAGIDGSLTVWDTENGTPLFTIAAHIGGIQSILYTPDGKWLVSGGKDGQTKIWDAESGALFISLPRQAGGVVDLAFSPDGQRLYTAGADGSVRAYLMDVDQLIALAQARVARILTTEECQQYLFLETCPPQP